MPEVEATRVTVRVGGEKCETPMRLCIEEPGGDLGDAVSAALELFGSAGGLHDAAAVIVITAHIIKPQEASK